MTVPDLSVVIASYNVRDLLHDCLVSVLESARTRARGNALTPHIPMQAEHSLQRIEVIVVDNASTDGSAEMVAQQFPDVRLIRNSENLGFARANNQGLACSRGRYVLLLNSDTTVPPSALANLVEFMERHPEAGACGPRLLQPDGRPQAFAFGDDPTLGYLLFRGLSRVFLGRPIHNWSTDQVLAVDWVSGACLLARRAAANQAGELDENIFLYFEDNDWCLRMRRAGWKIYYNPQISITHIGGQSVGRNPAARRAYYQSLDYFYGKHYRPCARFLLRLSLPIYRLVIRP